MKAYVAHVLSSLDGLDLAQPQVENIPSIREVRIRNIWQLYEWLKACLWPLFYHHFNVVLQQYNLA